MSQRTETEPETMTTQTRARRSFRWTAFAAMALTSVVPQWARAQTYVVEWGKRVVDSRWNVEAFVEVAAGRYHTVARRSDGTVVAWGDNWYGQCNVPALPSGLTYVEVAGG